MRYRGTGEKEYRTPEEADIMWRRIAIRLCYRYESMKRGAPSTIGARHAVPDIDTSRTNMKVKNIHRTDGDFAMSWIKDYGKGRIFYNAFGHENHIFWDPVILRHLLDGIQFVLGDLVCDTTPSAKIQIK